MPAKSKRRCGLRCAEAYPRSALVLQRGEVPHKVAGMQMQGLVKGHMYLVQCDSSFGHRESPFCFPEVLQPSGWP